MANPISRTLERVRALFGPRAGSEYAELPRIVYGTPSPEMWRVRLAAARAKRPAPAHQGDLVRPYMLRPDERRVPA